MIISLLLILSGCGNDIPSEHIDLESKNNMPEKIPSDFEFSVQFGIQSKNEINTFKNFVRKDLIVDGTARTEIFFTQEEMERIYQKMREINIMESKELIPDKSSCMQTPYGEDKWRIQLNDEIITFHWSGEFCDRTEDAWDLIELRDYIFSIVKNKEAFVNLPDAVGGYD